MNISQKESQCKMIFDYLRVAGTITPLEALEEIGCFRLSARILELRRMGYKIETVREHGNGKSWAKYIWRDTDHTWRGKDVLSY